MDLSGLAQALLVAFSELPDKGEELSVQDTGPKTFPKFPKMPVELQFNICMYRGNKCFLSRRSADLLERHISEQKLNLPSPRLLKVSHDPEKDEEAYCHTPTPTLLHVNQESRSEGLRRYRLSLPSSDMDDSKPIYYRSDWLHGITCLVLEGMELGKKVEEELRDGYIWAHIGKGTTEFDNSDNLVLPARQSPMLFFRRLASIHLILDEDFDGATDEELDEMEGFIKKLFKQRPRSPSHLVLSVMIYRYDQRSIVSVLLT
ncbi:hypothetical protein IFR05_003952 [Cadophora sp. M221]|nr:hypothetical protein IFR05_003952 [Cadophora sp. M221]